MELDKETQNKVQELQITEQNMQNFLMQKQAFQLELNEVESALSETKKSKEDVYKIVGQIMLKADKNDITKDLEEKKQTLALRIKSLEKQEKIFKEKMDKLRKELENKFKKK